MVRGRIMVNQNKEYYLGLYEKSMPNTLSWEEKLKVVKEAGFDYLEMSIDETEEKLARLDQSVDEIEKAIEKTGVPIKSICLSGHRKYPLGSHDPKIRERGMEIMEKAICLAARLGVRVIQLAGYDVYYEESTFETKKRFLANLKKAADMRFKDYEDAIQSACATRIKANYIVTRNIKDFSESKVTAIKPAELLDRI